MMNLKDSLSLHRDSLNSHRETIEIIKEILNLSGGIIKEIKHLNKINRKMNIVHNEIIGVLLKKKIITQKDIKRINKLTQEEFMEEVEQ